MITVNALKMYGFLFFLSCCIIAVSSQGSQATTDVSKSDNNNDMSGDTGPTTEAPDDGDKSIWEKIEEFYSDKNNMAMYCVLPILILVYGGCASIYCIHKCRQYLRRRKHKRLKEEDCDSLNSDKNDLNQESKGGGLVVPENRPVSQISQAWADMQENGWSGQTEAAPINGNSPLPWQVPDKAAAAAALSQATHRANTSSKASYLDDKLKDDDICLEEGRRTQASEGRRTASRSSMLNDKLVDEEMSENGRKSHAGNTVQVLEAATIASSSTDPNPTQQNISNPATAESQRQQQQQPERRKPPVIKSADTKPFEQTRVHANLEDYANNRSSAVKATDYSRFAESKPIEIIPLSADPHLRVWDPLHNRPFGENPSPRHPPKIQALGAEAGPSGSSGRASNQAMKDEMLARYDALSTFQMAKKAAEILQTNAVEKNPFQRKPTKKKHIFIAE